VLAVLILTIAAINAAGVYSQLVAAHVGRYTAAISAVDVQASAVDTMHAHAEAETAFSNGRHISSIGRKLCISIDWRVVGPLGLGGQD
jgi:hypothetical protein